MAGTSLLNDKDFVKLLDARLDKVEEEEQKYADLRAMIPKLYKTMTDEEARWEYFSTGPLPDIPEFSGSLEYLSVSPGFHTELENKQYAAGVMAERKFIDDKKFAVLDDLAKKLVRSANRTKEKLGVRTFGNAFSTAFDFMQKEEGVALCGSHTTKAGGVDTSSGFDNSGTSALTKTAVAASRLLMRAYKNSIGERIEIGDRLGLIVPDELADTAGEIVGTPKSYNTAEGNINMDHNRYDVINYMRLSDYSDSNWFLVDIDHMKDNLIWWDRLKPETNHVVDFETFAFKTSIYFRAAYGWLDWRWVYGHNVS